MSDSPDGSRSKIIITIISTVGLIIAAYIGYLAAIKGASLPIEATQTAEAFHTLAAMPTPKNSESQNTSEPSAPNYPSAIKIMDKYFGFINNANSKTDLIYAWSLESGEFQCAEAARCSLSKFQEFWLQFKVSYKLYDCGFNIVDTEQVYYPRDLLSTDDPSPLFYARYTLTEVAGQLKINSMKIIQSPSVLCKLMVSVP